MTCGSCWRPSGNSTSPLIHLSTLPGLEGEWICTISSGALEPRPGCLYVLFYSETNLLNLVEGRVLMLASRRRLTINRLNITFYYIIAL